MYTLDATGGSLAQVSDPTTVVGSSSILIIDMGTTLHRNSVSLHSAATVEAAQWAFADDGGPDAVTSTTKQLSTVSPGLDS